MIRVAVERHQGAIEAFRVSGHAGFAAAGSDIVCAAASAVAQTALAGLEERLGLTPHVEIESGDLFCRLPKDLAPGTQKRAQDLLETMLLGFRGIQQEFPDRIRINDPND